MSNQPAAPDIQPGSQRATVSAFVICCNEEESIKRCLESLKWCDEIVVVDSGSTDRTVEICRSYTRHVIQHPWLGFVEQKRLALQHCRGDWVLNIDADEEVSPGLRHELEQILEADAAATLPYQGYFLPRVVFYLGRWWRRGGWYPEYRLRFSRRAQTSWGGENPHEKAVVDGPTRRLTGELYHYTYTDISDQVRSLNAHSTTAALSLFHKGAACTLAAALARPVTRFIKFYFLKMGFREGPAGLIVAILEAFYVFLKYAKLWELRRAGQNTAAAGGEASD